MNDPQAFMASFLAGCFIAWVVDWMVRHGE